MKKNIIPILGLLLIGTLNSCFDDFLKEEPFDFLGSENFYKNKADALAALDAVYSSFQGTGMNGNLLLGVADLPTDQVLERALLGSGAWGQFEEFSLVAENGNGKDIWEDHYKAINRCNAVLTRVPEINTVDLGDELKNRILGEASFFRGLAYFNLVRLFVNVPLVTAEIIPLSEANVSNVGTESSVWDLIISDLEFAESNLPISYSGADFGRVTKYAASGILAKVYLQRSGLGKANEWNLAISKTKEIMDNGTYSLQANYADVFDINNEWNSEILFAINFIAGYGNQDQSVTPMTAITGSIPSGGYGRYASEPEFFESWDTSDLRYDATWLTEFVSSETGDTVTYPEDVGVFWNGFVAISKYRSNDAEGNNEYGLDIPVLRYSDILLMNSEAENEANGPSADAVYGLNLVRERAGQLPIDHSTVNKQQLKDIIIHERALEFVMEAQGYFDYQRWGILEEKNPEYNVQPHHYYLPIPQRELDLNPNLVQNEGY